MADGEDDEVKPPVEGLTARTSRQIAFLLIALFASLLVAVFVASVAVGDAAGAERWGELFQSGFLLLSGAVTTVTGYYFGSRGAQEAEATATKAVREASEAQAEAAAQRRIGEELRAELEAPTVDETALQVADEFLEDP